LDDPGFGSKGFFSLIYHARDGVLTKNGLPKDVSIWESQEAWDAFYGKYFGKLKSDSLGFLIPFLDEIKKVRLNTQP
jgi:hypothetical protein